MISIIIIVLIMGCSDRSASSPEKAGSENVPHWATELMQMLPGDAQIVGFNDVDSLRSDVTLQDEYNRNKALFEELTNLAFVPSFDQIAYWAFTRELCLLKGAFNFIEVRANLSDDGWVCGDSSTLEIWGKAERKDELVALPEGLIIWGTDDSLNEVIKIMEGKCSSLYEDHQFRELMMNSTIMNDYLISL